MRWLKRLTNSCSTVRVCFGSEDSVERFKELALEISDILKVTADGRCAIVKYIPTDDTSRFLRTYVSEKL